MLMDTSARKFTWGQLTVSCLFGSETLKEAHLWLLLDVASDDDAHHAHNDNALMLLILMVVI